MSRASVQFGANRTVGTQRTTFGSVATAVVVATALVLSTVGGFTSPRQAAASGAGQNLLAYVLSNGTTAYASGGEISAIDTVSNSIVNHYWLPSYSFRSLGVTLDGSRVVAVGHNNAGSGVICFAETTFGATGCVAWGQDISVIATAPDGSGFYLLDPVGSQVAKIGLNGTVVSTYSLAGDLQPRSLAVGTDGTTLYVAGNAWLQAIDTTTGAVGAKNYIGFSANGASSVLASGGHLYLTGTNSQVSDISTASYDPINESDVQKRLLAMALFWDGSPEVAVAAAPDGSVVYSATQDNFMASTTNYNDGFGYQPFPDPSTDHALAVMPDNSAVYVTNASTNSVSVWAGGLFGNFTGEHISVAPDPVAIAMMPAQAPTASLKVTLAPQGSPTTLDASESTVTNGRISSYEWDFGDGTSFTTTTPVVTHVYTGGSYTASVTVSNLGVSTTSAHMGQGSAWIGSPSATATALGSVAPGAPVVSAVKPSGGPTAGGTVITINGTGLTGAAQVLVGGVPATNLKVKSDTQMSATVPGGAAGPADVTVSNVNGNSSVSPADVFTYQAPPVTAIDPCASGYCQTTVLTPNASLSASSLPANNCAAGCSLSTGITAIQSQPLTCPGGGSPTPQPVGWVDYLQTNPQTILSGMSIQLVYNGWLNYNVGNLGALQMVQVCWSDNVPAIVGRTAARSATAATRAKPTKGSYLSSCDATGGSSPCVVSTALVDGNLTVNLRVPVGSSAFAIQSRRPTLGSITPATGPAGTSIVLKGRNLGVVRYVVMGGVSAQITAASPTSMTVTVPDGAASGAITLVTGRGVVLTRRVFTVT